ncbi:MAG TPA: hypothetical protein VJR02_11035 [Pyrinomonadaceae bacterium]|nr:hypothetical protein [Pyrinomonadaceae bacterium]
MNDDPEIKALTTVYTALQDLDPEAQQRVLDYVARKLGLQSRQAPRRDAVSREDLPSVESSSDSRSPTEEEIASELEGISPVALKWMRRNAFNADDLGRLFSIGADEIDLVANTVPGKSKNSRLRSVVLLKGIAEYLSTGAARITYEQIKEASLHYDAYDSTNHAKYLKGLSAELSGSRSGGFVLTARGLTAGTELIKTILKGTANS